ncbi:hypothetical protein IJJ08_02325 [bacterium]|nr:hypothetical protein [bacterium]
MSSQEENLNTSNNTASKYQPNSDDTSTIVTIGVFIVIVTLVGAAAITTYQTPRSTSQDSFLNIASQNDDGQPLPTPAPSSPSHVAIDNKIDWEIPPDNNSIVVTDTQEQTIAEHGSKIFTYTGAVQTVTLKANHTYYVELWGAQGGNIDEQHNDGGCGAYTAGILTVDNDTIVYVYVGEHVVGNGEKTAAFNAGGAGGVAPSSWGSGGGGATDIRLIKGEWYDTGSLSSRIMVAGGGGGALNYAGCRAKGGSAGGLVGYSGTNTNFAFCGDESPDYINRAGGTQVTSEVTAGDFWRRSAFGQGGSAPSYGSGGGGGWYGGEAGGSVTNYVGTGGGGSSYIAGHAGCVGVASQNDPDCLTKTPSVECSLSPTGYHFESTTMIDGEGYAWDNQRRQQERMPTPNGDQYPLGVGHTGHGVAKISDWGINSRYNDEAY